MTIDRIRTELASYHDKFTTLAYRYDGTLASSEELETTIDRYSDFITDAENHSLWDRLERDSSDELHRLAAGLRRSSAQCVTIMEKYRALKLLGGESERTDYFQNIEACIEQEFGSFRVASDSRVVLIGSGSFPMTPLFIAKRTGASVVGIDIDEEAVELGRKVIDRLGRGLNIRLLGGSAEHHPEELRMATHLIFSSTVSEKYELLDRLHALTDRQVVVAMRYGDRLKSLFNYPMREVDGRKWRLVETVLRPEQVFDIALYRRA
ncbi:class I SAM-dependent methyltransferase [Cohnella xylanilytica]|uniref:Class I SAM-dependent methyltransferase n=1 Tax=Cohnella xylanilytica TaxID=557555 RepID=A0A841TPB6_9BACL|nr:class I SAM-dependent methyltransferase [Cohnella xylanilytica]MBB6689995.1 class I SAM-dependent methyltransferase [Cohnella xylanilytica]